MPGYRVAQWLAADRQPLVVFSLLIVAAATGAVLFAIGDPSRGPVCRPDFLALLMGPVLGIVMLTQAATLIAFTTLMSAATKLAAYLAMNVAAFSAIVIHERAPGFSDSIASLRGTGRSNPMVAWPLTIAMLALAGLPPTAGFIGKLYLFQALVEADWTWLGFMIAIGTMISLVYYMRVVAMIWMSPVEGAEPATASDEPGADSDAARRWYLVVPAVIGAAAAIFFGIIPQPLVEFAQHAGNALFAYIS